MNRAQEVAIHPGICQPSWKSEYRVHPAVLIDQVLLALEKVGREVGMSLPFNLSDATVSPRLRFTIPKPFKLDRITTPQTHTEFLRTIMATIYALPDENRTTFLAALQPLMTALEHGGYLPKPAAEAITSKDEKQYVDLDKGFMVMIDGEPVLFEEKDARLYDFFQFLLLQTRSASFHEIGQFLLGLERQHTNREIRRQFIDTSEIFNTVKQLEGVLTTIPHTQSFSIHIDMSSKRIAIYTAHTNVQVSYYLGQRIQEQRMDADRWKRAVSPLIGSCGLERFIPEPQAKFIEFLQDLTTSTATGRALYPDGWIPQQDLIRHLLREVPYLASNPGEREFSLGLLFSRTEQSIAPLQSFVERKSEKPAENQLPIAYYRLNPRLQKVDPPRSAQPPLDFDF